MMCGVEQSPFRAASTGKNQRDAQGRAEDEQTPGDAAGPSGLFENFQESEKQNRSARRMPRKTWIRSMPA